MKENIVHLVSSFPSKSETFIINQITASIERGFGATILADGINELEISSQAEILQKYNLYDSARCATPDFPQNKLRRFILAIILLCRNLRHFKVFFRSLNKAKFGNKASSLKLWYQAAIFLKYNEVKLFHAHFGVNGIVLADLKEIGAIKGSFVVSFYGYDTFSDDQNRTDVIKSYERLFKLAQVLLVNSKYLEGNLKLLLAPQNKIFRSYVGVDQSLFVYYERSFKQVVNLINVGRLIKLKGQFLAIKLVKNLKDKNYIVNLNLIGDGEELCNLKAQARELGIQDQIKFLGSQNQKSIVELFNQNDVFLMTSITDETGRAEGQGLVTAEAQATGLPAIGFNSGGVPETILDGKTGFIVEERDIEGMAENVIKLINNPEMRKEFGQNACQFISISFNNLKQANKIVDVYVDLIKNGNE